MVLNQKNDNDVTLSRHDVTVKTFWRCSLSIVKFSYWPKFHVNIITGSRVLAISGNQKYPCLSFVQYLEMSLMKSYSMLQNARVTTFIVFELLRKNQINTLPTTQIRIKKDVHIPHIPLLLPQRAIFWVLWRWWYSIFNANHLLLLFKYCLCFKSWKVLSLEIHHKSIQAGKNLKSKRWKEKKTTYKEMENHSAKFVEYRYHEVPLLLKQLYYR